MDPPIPASSFTLQQLDGSMISLSDYHGQVVVMEFWATWCAPCRHTVPSLDIVYRRFQKSGVAVLLINQGEAPDTIRDWIAGRISAPILLDQDRAVAGRYGIQGLPHLFVLNPQGQIVYARSGYGGGLERQLSRILEDLLKGVAHG